MISDIDLHLNRVRRTLDGYEAMGVPTGPVAGTLAMIRDELAILAEIAAEHPERREELAQIERRLSELATRVRLW